MHIFTLQLEFVNTLSIVYCLFVQVTAHVWINQDGPKVSGMNLWMLDQIGDQWLVAVNLHIYSRKFGLIFNHVSITALTSKLYLLKKVQTRQKKKTIHLVSNVADFRLHQVFCVIVCFRVRIPKNGKLTQAQWTSNLQCFSLFWSHMVAEMALLIAISYFFTLMFLGCYLAELSIKRFFFSFCNLFLQRFLFIYFF